MTQIFLRLILISFVFISFSSYGWGWGSEESSEQEKFSNESKSLSKRLSMSQRGTRDFEGAAIELKKYKADNKNKMISKWICKYNSVTGWHGGKTLSDSGMHECKNMRDWSGVTYEIYLSKNLPNTTKIYESDIVVFSGKITKIGIEQGGLGGVNFVISEATIDEIKSK